MPPVAVLTYMQETDADIHSTHRGKRTEASISSGDLQIKFQGINVTSPEKRTAGKADYYLTYQIFGDDDGLLDMLKDAMEMNAEFRNMCKKALEETEPIKKPQPPTAAY